MKNLTPETKQKIISHLRQYLATHKVSQARVAKVAGMSESYMSNILNGKHESVTDGMWNSLALAIHYYEDTAKMQPAETRNHEILTQAASSGLIRSIALHVEGDTGTGKTNWALHYTKVVQPHSTVYIKYAGDMSQRDMAMQLCYALGLGVGGSAYEMRLRIRTYVLNRTGGTRFLIIIDEGENASESGIKFMKALWDDLEGIGSIMLLTTRDFTKRVRRHARNNRSPYPQIERRFMGATISLYPFAKKDAKLFFAHHGINDNEVINELCRMDKDTQPLNYGLLTDRITAMRDLLALRLSQDATTEITKDLAAEAIQPKTIA